MKVLFVDLETTGLCWERDQIIEVGAVVDDLANPMPLFALPTFRRVIRRDRYSGSPAALAMHADLLRRVATHDRDLPLCDEEDVAPDLARFLIFAGVKAGSVTAGGKNVAGFDFNFLGRLPGFGRDGSSLTFDSLYPGSGGWTLRNRAVDPAILFADLTQDDALPSLDECLKRAGLAKRTDHTAVGDCLLCAELVRVGMRRMHRQARTAGVTTTDLLV